MLYRALPHFLDPRRKTKIGIRRKHTSFLRRSDIGQFVTGDELILPWRRRGGGSIASSSFQVEKWPDPKGLIKSIDVLEAIRFLGSGHKHDGGRVENVVPAPWWGEASAAYEFKTE